MITLKELNPNNYKTTPEQDANLQILLDRLNVVRAAWGRPMIITSGLRSQEDQQRINPKATKSHHLMAEAADISDPKGELKKWILSNIPLMEQTGFWFEDFGSTPNWCHMQIVPPKSGNRIFKP